MTADAPAREGVDERHEHRRGSEDVRRTLLGP
jgi:hypothetical protein